MTEQVPMDQGPDLPPALLARLVERLKPLEIWLIGSRAEGRARPDSDWDLLVVMPDDTPTEMIVKATLIRFGIQPERTHDIERLLTLLPIGAAGRVPWSGVGAVGK